MSFSTLWFETDLALRQSL